jgi:hypothetical protein
VTTSNDRVGDVFELNWIPTNLQTPSEIHAGLLTYTDSAGNSFSNVWTFLNLKDVYLPTASAGYYIPTNAVVIEDFSEYPDPTDFTNGAPEAGVFIGAPIGPWYLSPQTPPAINPLVDIAPIWTNTPPGPTNWFVWNWDAPGDGVAFDPTDPDSGAYANFLCVDLNTFSGIEGSALNTAPWEMINGQPLVQLIANPGNNILVAESDNRAGNTVTSVPGQDPGQNQYAISKQFDLTGVTNPVLAWASIQRQNQDNINTFEYSVDGGVTWAPIIYYLDGQSFNDVADGPDIHVAADNSVDVESTLFHDTDPGEIPTWTDSTGDVNNTYAAAVAAPITSALGPFFAPRINDDSYEGKRIEVVRLPLASNKSDVRFRLGQIGSCSWYFGIAEMAIYDVPPSGAVVPTGLPPSSQPVLAIRAASGKVTLNWTGTATLQSATSLTGSWSNVSPAPTGNTFTVAIGSGDLFFRLVSN